MYKKCKNYVKTVLSDQRYPHILQNNSATTATDREFLGPHEIFIYSLSISPIFTIYTINSKWKVIQVIDVDGEEEIMRDREVDVTMNG